MAQGTQEAAKHADAQGVPVAVPYYPIDVGYRPERVVTGPGSIGTPYPAAGYYNPSPRPSYLEGDSGFNIQWVLFILGFFFWVTSLVACFLPMCRPKASQFPSRSYKAGWIANVMLTTTCLILSMVIAVVYTRALSVYYSQSPAPSSSPYGSGN